MGPAQLSWSSSSSDGPAAWGCRAPGDDNSVLPFNCTLDQVSDCRGQESWAAAAVPASMLMLLVCMVAFQTMQGLCRVCCMTVRAVAVRATMPPHASMHHFDPLPNRTLSALLCLSLQVMDPAVMYSHGAAFAGRPVLFREAPFLRNPRSPSWIRHAATTISSGAPAGCPEDGSPCAQVLQGKPPPGINQQVG